LSSIGACPELVKLEKGRWQVLFLDRRLPDLDVEEPSDTRIWRPNMSAMTAMPVLPAFGGALIASPSSALREQVLHHLNGRWQPVQQALGGAEKSSLKGKGLGK
jgi:hypothetical protein